jgi:hypothetical protein
METELANQGNKEEGLVKRIWKEERKTMKNYLISAGVATAARLGVTYYADNSIDSDVTVASLATIVDMTSFWGTFIPQLVYRDKNKLKNDQGNYDSKKVLKKVAEYGSMVGIIEGAYAAASISSQYALQKNGMEPVAASAIVVGGAIAFFSVALPPIRYALRQWSEK